MAANHELTNETRHRILTRVHTSAEILSKSVLGNICEGKLVYDKTANKLYICTQSTDGITDGVLAEIGV